MARPPRLPLLQLLLAVLTSGPLLPWPTTSPSCRHLVSAADAGVRPQPREQVPSDEAAFLMSYASPEGPLVKRPAPQGEEAQFEWRRQETEAQQAEAQGNLQQALQSYLVIWQSSFLYASMMDEERYRVHLQVARLLVRLGMLPRAEALLYEATSLVSEPVEAYRLLARLKAQQGMLGPAVLHYKHLLFFTPEDLEALQKLGALLIVSGDINQGRHYLIRAVSLWEKDVKRSLAAITYTARHGTSRLYHWLPDYLLAPLSSSTSTDVNSTSWSEEVETFALLSHLVKQPQPLTARAHLELAATIADLGLHEQSRLHLRYCLSQLPGSTSSSLSSSLTRSLASLRQALDVVDPLSPGPLPASFFEEQHASPNGEEGGEPHPIPFADLFEVFAPLPALLASLTLHPPPTSFLLPPLGKAAATIADGYEEYPVARLLWRYSPELLHPPHSSAAPPPPVPARPPSSSPPPPPPPLLSIALLSSLLPYDASLALLTSSLLSRLRASATLTLYLPPGPPLPPSLSSLFHRIVPLPSSSFPPAGHHDVLLLPDLPDTATYFTMLRWQRIAPVQATYAAYMCGGLSLGLPAIDFHLHPAALLHQQQPPAFAEQMVTLGPSTNSTGLSYLLPYLRHLHAAHPSSSSPPRHTYGAHTFFHHQHLLLLPVLPWALPSPPSLLPLLSLLLESDPAAEIVLLPYPAPASPTSLLPQRYHQHLLSSLPPAHARRLRLLPPLPSPSDRLALLRITTALLHLPPGGPIPAHLEALAAACPILAMAHTPAAALLRNLGGMPGELLAIASEEEYAAVAVELGREGGASSLRERAARASRSVMERAMAMQQEEGAPGSRKRSSGGGEEEGEDLIRFLRAAVAAVEDDDEEEEEGKVIATDDDEEEEGGRVEAPAARAWSLWRRWS